MSATLGGRPTDKKNASVEAGSEPMTIHMKRTCHHSTIGAREIQGILKKALFQYKIFKRISLYHSVDSNKWVLQNTCETGVGFRADPVLFCYTINTLVYMYNHQCSAETPTGNVDGYSICVRNIYGDEYQLRLTLPIMSCIVDGWQLVAREEQ